MENKFVKGILTEFRKDFNLESIEESKAFEYLVNYLVVSKIHPEAFANISDLQQIDVDSGSTFGIDGIAIIVNNNLLLNKEDIDIYKKSRNLDIKIIFTQSKTSAVYDGGSLYKFIGAVQNFFSANPEIELTEDIKFFKKLYDTLFEHEYARFIPKDSPKCYLYFATTGKEASDSTVLGIAKQGEKTISDSIQELKEVKINLVGADYVIDTYNDIENRYDVIINFKNNLTLDRISNVEQSYIGYLNYGEFFKLITDQDKEIRRNLFYENVRDFQGSDNRVNQEISETLTVGELRDKFILLNNGITVVANYLKPLGSNDYEIRDYQIVNGCQTSTILFNHKAVLEEEDNFWIPVKFIHTIDNEVINRIIRATNRQTPVPDEAFVALEKFHKRLQEFYVAMSKDCKETLYYERRSKEYLNVENKIEKNRIINLHSQIRSFASIFLALPQLVYNNNPNEILRTRNKLFFKDDHQYYPYFTSSYILFSFGQEINRGRIPASFGLFRHYIGLIVKVLATGKLKNPYFNSHEMKNFCNKVLSKMDNDKTRIELFKKAIEILKISIAEEKKQIGKHVSVKSIIRTTTFKDQVFAQLKKKSNLTAS